MKLTVPRIDSGRRPISGATLAELAPRLQKLPLADAEQAARQLGAILTEQNRVEIELDQRCRMLEAMCPLGEQLIEALRKKYLTATFPLAERARVRADLVDRLLTELAFGHKIVIGRWLAAGTKVPPSLLASTVYFATRYLAMRLVEHYLLYAPIPPMLWGELNTLYAHAQRERVQTQTIGLPSECHGTIERIYLQAVLLSVMNPYRMMRGEAGKVFDLLQEWSGHCRLLPLPAGWQPQGELVVDPEADEAPFHAVPGRAIPEAARLRMLNVEALRAVIAERVEQTQATRSDGRSPSLLERMQRDMLFRLVHRWGSKLDRVEERLSSGGAIELVFGLTACYHIYGGVDKSTEEPDASAAPAGLGKLSLIPKDQHEWSPGAAPGPGRDKAVRASRFKIDDPERDVWTRDYVHADMSAALEPTAPEFATHTLSKKDESAGGVAVAFAAMPDLSLRVGELVGVREGGEAAAWKLGVVRWMSLIRDGGGELGIQILSDSARPVSSKALRGAGQGGDYTRGLLIPAGELNNPDASLMVAAAIYDVGSILIVDAGSATARLSLSALKDSTEAFACFRYVLVND